MVINQGHIIKLDFNPIIGHEQVGFRLALVISNETFNKNTGLLIVLPITNTNSDFPLHIPLDNRTKTNGYILCEHIKSIDKVARKATYVETIPDDLLNKVIKMIKAEIKIEKTKMWSGNFEKKNEQFDKDFSSKYHYWPGEVILDHIEITIMNKKASALHLGFGIEHINN